MDNTKRKIFKKVLGRGDRSDRYDARRGAMGGLTKSQYNILKKNPETYNKWKQLINSNKYKPVPDGAYRQGDYEFGSVVTFPGGIRYGVPRKSPNEIQTPPVDGFKHPWMEGYVPPTTKPPIRPPYPRPPIRPKPPIRIGGPYIPKPIPPDRWRVPERPIKPPYPRPPIKPYPKPPRTQPLLEQPQPNSITQPEFTNDQEALDWAMTNFGSGTKLGSKVDNIFNFDNIEYKMNSDGTVSWKGKDRGEYIGTNTDGTPMYSEPTWKPINGNFMDKIGRAVDQINNPKPAPDMPTTRPPIKPYPKPPRAQTLRQRQNIIRQRLRGFNSPAIPIQLFQPKPPTPVPPTFQPKPPTPVPPTNNEFTLPVDHGFNKINPTIQPAPPTQPIQPTQQQPIATPAINKFTNTGPLPPYRQTLTPPSIQPAGRQRISPGNLFKRKIFNGNGGAINRRREVLRNAVSPVMTNIYNNRTNKSMYSNSQLYK